MATAAQYLSIGGKSWTSQDGTKHRIYFPASVLQAALGFAYTTYKTGNISRASLGGETVSNGHATQLRTMLDFGKCWYDLESDTLGSKGLGRYAEDIMEEIERRAHAAQD